MRSPSPFQPVVASIAGLVRWLRSSRRSQLAGGDRGGVGEDGAAGVSETGAAVRERLDRVAALVHEPVVAATEQEQVGELRLASPCPVLDVVCVYEAAVLAAGEAAAVVPRSQCPP
jgi:hypothetical protein